MKVTVTAMFDSPPETIFAVHTNIPITWIVESQETGIVQMAEPMVVKQANEMMRISSFRLKTHLKAMK